MKRLSLDTSFIVDFLDGAEEAKTFLEKYEYDQLVIPSVVKMEVKWGNRDISEFDKLEVLGFDEEDVGKTIEFKNYLEKQGAMINRLDIMIAAQAANSGTALVTAEEDFAELDAREKFESVNFKEVVEHLDDDG